MTASLYLSFFFTLSFSLFLAITLAATAEPPPELYSALITQKILNTAQNFTTPPGYPEYTTVAPNGDGEGPWVWFPLDTWTSGFLPGELMLLAERAQKCPGGQLVNSNDSAMALYNGLAWSTPLQALETNNSFGHDVGFVSFPFQTQLELDPANTTAQAAVNGFAAYLAGRYSPIVGCTRSWDTPNATEFEVIIDNMINIELFFISADLNGNQTYRDMAISHANKTMQNHVRADGSTFHVVVYDADTGAVLAQETAQGYANNSTWTRGQAWAMYGFTSMYNRTRQEQFLDTARRVSQFYVDHLPTGNTVPPWDFNAPADPIPPRDTSSATIASTAMLFLSQMESAVGNSTGSQYWQNAAITLLRDTISLAFRTEANWQAILSNGTSDNPLGINNTGLIYGDYYFLKAGNMLLDLGLAFCESSGSGTATSGPSNGTSTSTGSGSSTTTKSGAGMIAPSFFLSVTAAMLGALSLS